jgi:Spinocerebellar ataxia type 10 protein domain
MLIDGDPDDRASDLIRSLRNECAQSAAIQQSIVSSESLLQVLFDAILLPLSASQNPLKNIDELRPLACQMLHNSAVGNSQLQQELWSVVSPRAVDLLAVASQDSKFAFSACALIHVLSFGSVDRLSNVVCNGPLFAAFLNCCKNDRQNDDDDAISYLCLLVRRAFDCGIGADMMRTVGSSDDERDRLAVFHAIDAFVDRWTSDERSRDRSLVRSDDGNDDAPLVADDVVYLATEFRRRCNEAHKSSQESIALGGNSSLIVTMLHVLANITAHATNALRDQLKQAALVETSLGLLRIAKMAAGGASSSSSAAAASSSSASSAYGFRRELVRIVANMSYRHRPTQDEVRILEGIPLLLDLCTLDGNNPFIREWALLAIRNLCEENIDNQRVIEAIKPIGVADPDGLRREFGIEAQLVDGRIKFSNPTEKL